MKVTHQGTIWRPGVYNVFLLHYRHGTIYVTQGPNDDRTRAAIHSSDVSSWPKEPWMKTTFERAGMSIQLAYRINVKRK